MEAKRTRVPKSVKIFLLICGGLVVMLMVYCLLCFAHYRATGIKAIDYVIAGTAYEQKQYDYAYPLFFALNDYKDSRSRADECAALCATLEVLGNVQIRDTVYFGIYKQDDATESKAEPIQWIVLEKSGENLLLLSKYSLTKREFGGADWENSGVREWLNKEFYDSAFTQQEKNFIQAMITSQDTTDKVFCLTPDEEFFIPKNQREGTLVQNAGVAEDTRWWTRYFNSSNGTIAACGASSLLDDISYLTPDTPIGVRPAISISTSGKADGKAKDMSIFDSKITLPPSTSGSTSNSYRSSKKPSGSSSGKCIMCNGTGSAKYYYGESDLEALLTGHNPYEWGPCPMCHGTGKNDG